MIYRPSRRALLGGLVAAPVFLPGLARAAELGFADFPFTLGVSAGDALPDGFVLWTRLAPDPLAPHGGMPMAPVPVNWEVAEDDGFRTIVAKGQETAWPELGHSVHAEVSGLKPGRPYWYRFRCGGELSLAGRAATLPAPGTTVDRVRFAAAGCQHFESGYYTAYRHLAEENDLDFVFHYGDYIYEYSAGVALNGLHQPIDPVRRYLGREPYSLDDYRLRYAQTTLDSDMQAARAAHPWFVSYDDHEVQNNWTGDTDKDDTPAALFRLRRAAALQAWYEHMPVRRSAMPDATGLVEFRRRFDYGTLLRGHLLNTRLYRSDQPCGDGFKPLCTPMTGDVLGRPQEAWLDQGLATSRQRWQLIAQQVMVAAPDRRTPEHDGPQPTFNMDSWAGYPLAQRRLFDRFAAHRPGNIVVVTGDEHQNWANDLVRDDGRIVASEFVATSISSGGDGYDTRPGNDEIMRHNSFVKWTNDRRGYLLTEVTPDAWTGDFRTVAAVSTAGAPVRTAARWQVAAGQAGLRAG
ncbi:alkaline phosphatase D family protein [Sphingomonas morindae]|uniref:Alkaline phosphatase D family protein n=1 Tax=Sphingomonas morindae TaxID=1541170 RepID=A0ABY4X6X7_9SPHN|nr:alkaline phosphatase D family protein [Sphingomonas morindae]USI72673.1 alkaline phosphatase D family protein [Sphingomonas morindae]